jgi:DNA modification methylase
MSIELICGDCLVEMKKIPDKSIDLVLTDPPYGIGFADWDNIDFFPFMENLYIEFMRILKDRCIAFIWFPKKKIYQLEKLTFKFDVFICTKNFAQKRIYDVLIDCWVPILMFSNGKSRNVKCKGSGKNWFMINTANTSKNSCRPKNIGHPTPKDPDLCKYILRSASKQGETVLDPFMGSGTTGMACKELGRNFIGIEISPEYFKIAERRINNTVENLL